MLDDYKPGHISSSFFSSSNYSQWLFETFRRYFSESGTQRIFPIGSSLSRDRVLEKWVNILQTAMHIPVTGFRIMGSLYGMVSELRVGCWSYNQLEFGTCYVWLLLSTWLKCTVAGRGKKCWLQCVCTRASGSRHLLLDLLSLSCGEVCNHSATFLALH